MSDDNGNPAEELHILHEACLVILDSFRFMWMDRDGGFTDLQGWNFGDHVNTLGQLAFSFQPRLHLFKGSFGLLSRVSRKPFGTLFISASSTTEYTVKNCCVFVQALDNTVQGIRLRKPGGLTPEEKETYRKCWKTLREPFDNSGFIPTYAKAVEMAAEVDWEYQRALGLLPPAPRKQPIIPLGTIEVFFSYSHKDERHRDALSMHLSQLKHEKKIRDWHDRQISAMALR